MSNNRNKDHELSDDDVIFTPDPNFFQEEPRGYYTPGKVVKLTRSKALKKQQFAKPQTEWFDDERARGVESAVIAIALVIVLALYFGINAIISNMSLAEAQELPEPCYVGQAKAGNCIPVEGQHCAYTQHWTRGDDGGLYCPDGGSMEAYKAHTYPHHPTLGRTEPEPQAVVFVDPNGPIPPEIIQAPAGDETPLIYSPVDGLEVPFLYGIENYFLEWAWWHEVRQSCTDLGLYHYELSKRARARCGCL